MRLLTAGFSLVKDLEQNGAHVKTVAVIGAYGGAGRAICRCLLQHTAVCIVPVGRNKARLETLARELQQRAPERVAAPVQADVRQDGSLTLPLKNADVAVIASTTPEAMPAIASAALKHGTDLIDIFVRSDVPEMLAPFQADLLSEGRIIVTQCGFHPGMAAPLVRKTCGLLSDCLSAEVYMAMNARFETAASTHEILHDLIADTAQIYSGNGWRRATYRDARHHRFSKAFGERQCYPIDLPELRGIPEAYGLESLGAYVAGFNWFVDNIAFSLIMALAHINKSMAIQLGGRLLKFGVNNFSPKGTRIEMAGSATGSLEGRLVRATVSCLHDDPYVVTAAPVVACIKQYLDGGCFTPGIQLMGNAIEVDRLFADLENMGLHFEEKIEAVTPA